MISQEDEVAFDAVQIGSSARGWGWGGGGGGWGVLFVDDIRLPTTTAPISNNKMGSVKSGRSGAVDAAVAS